MANPHDRGLPRTSGNSSQFQSKTASKMIDRCDIQYEMGPKEITGYCFVLSKATEHHTGESARQALRSRGINLGIAPPFQKAIQGAGLPDHGVVKINNIPFTVTTQEVKHFISRITPHPPLEPHISGYPIHIIMEKPTGKTMECFVEFPSISQARDCVLRFDNLIHTPKARLGSRNVTLDMSSQAELRAALFPRARLIVWDEQTGAPTLLPDEYDPSWTEGFRGYFTIEEIFGLTRFADNPARSPFAVRCNQRVYESLISTLYKFPWAATTTYTVGARDLLFRAVLQQLRILACKVLPPRGDFEHHSVSFGKKDTDMYDHDFREVGLSQRLLMDLLFAALNAPGFSQLQKYAIVQAAGHYGSGVRLSPFAGHWPFQTLHPLSTLPAETADVITKFYLELFDSGYDLISSSGETQPTTFEKYCQINRNAVGFPVVEWTLAGIELNFNDAMKVETAIMTMYVERGRAQWCYERDVHSLPLAVYTLQDVIDMADTDTDNHCEPTDRDHLHVVHHNPIDGGYGDANVSKNCVQNGQKAVSDPFVGNATETLQTLITNANPFDGKLNSTPSNFHPSTAPSFSADAATQRHQRIATFRVESDGASDFTFPDRRHHSLDNSAIYPHTRSQQCSHPAQPTGGIAAAMISRNAIEEGFRTIQAHNAARSYLPQFTPSVHEHSHSNLSIHSSPERSCRSDQKDLYGHDDHCYIGQDHDSTLPSPSVHSHSRSLSGSVYGSPVKSEGVKSKENILPQKHVAKAALNLQSELKGIAKSLPNTQSPDFGPIGNCGPAISSTTSSLIRGPTPKKPKVVYIDQTIHEDEAEHPGPDQDESDKKTTSNHSRRASSLGQPGPAVMIAERERPTDPYQFVPGISPAPGFADALFPRSTASSVNRDTKTGSSTSSNSKVIAQLSQTQSLPQQHQAVGDGIKSSTGDNLARINPTRDQSGVQLQPHLPTQSLWSYVKSTGRGRKHRHSRSTSRQQTGRFDDYIIRRENAAIPIVRPPSEDDDDAKNEGKSADESNKRNDTDMPDVKVINEGVNDQNATGLKI